MPSELPVLLISEQAKRKLAKEQIKTAIASIKTLGPLAGISDRSLFEFVSLAKFMETEMLAEKKR